MGRSVVEVRRTFPLPGAKFVPGSSMRRTGRRSAAGLLAAASLAGLAVGCAPPQPARRPNVVLLLADDLGYGDLGGYGAPDVRTPNLDRLARSGARFTDAYAAAPVCSPTRAALLTGLYPQRLGHNFEDFLHVRTVGLDPSRHTTLAELLRRAGYRTACYGKWNVEGSLEPGRSSFLPNQHGFEHWFGSRRNHDRFTHLDVWTGELDLFEDGRPVQVQGYTDTLLAEHAVSFIESARASDRPFFLYVPWLIPHYPLQSPDNPAIVPVGHRPTYVAMVEYLDLLIGWILEALRTAGLERDTLVLFTSDNGGNTTARNAPLSGGKKDLSEGGIRVPLLASWPGQIPSGQVIATPVVTMDLTVTILAAAGLGDSTRNMDGVDLLPMLTGRAALAPRLLFWRRREFRPKTGVDEVLERAVRDGDWKLLVSDAPPRLYELARDPGEHRDLAAREPEIVARLLGALEGWESRVEPAQAPAAAPASYSQGAAAEQTRPDGPGGAP